MATNIIVARGGVEYVPPISLAFWRWLTVFIILFPFFYNEILKNRVTKKTRSYGPTTTDVLAIIPLKGVTSLRANKEPYIEFGSSVQSNTRTYFGPVNIERLRVKLIDDKGNLMNLYDNDWSFSIIVEQLYQY